MFDVAEDVAETDPTARRGRLIVERERRDVHVRIRRLAINEGCVLSAQLLHDLDPPSGAGSEHQSRSSGNVAYAGGQAQSAWDTKSRPTGEGKSHGGNEPRIHTARRRTRTAPQRRCCDERGIGHRPPIVHRCARRGCQRRIAATAELLRAGGKLQAELFRIVTGSSDLTVDRSDERFGDEAWESNPIFKRIGQAYVAWTRSLDEWLAGSGLKASRNNARVLCSAS